MKRLFKRLFLIFFLGTFFLSVYQISEYWNYQETLVDITKQLRLNVTATQIQAEIETAIKQQNYDDAKMYLSIAESNNYAIDANYYQQLITQQDTNFKRIIKQSSNFVNGFIKGESATMAGIAGAVSADFTVVGDARDLKKQYDIYQQGKDVNELIIILSGVGIGLTAATVVSLGVATPAKTGTSLVKLAVKTQRLTRGFQKQLIKQGRKVFDWSAFTRLVKQDKSITSIRRSARKAYHPDAIQPLKKMATQVNGIRKSSSAADTLHMLKYVENSNDLRHLEKITLKHGASTKGLLKLVGKGALRTVRVLRKSLALLLSIIGSVISAVFSLIFLFTSRFGIFARLV